MDMMQMEAAAGTFYGHGIPGSLFIVWALYWAAHAMGRPARAGGSRTLESNAVVPGLKIVLAPVGMWFEIPGEGWYPQDVMMSWEHVTMYFVFGLSGGVDLLARRGLVSGGATYVAYAAAMLNAGFLFWGHSTHGGVEGLVHVLLALVFFTVTLIAIAEAVWHSGGLWWGRLGAQLALGSWFFVGAWILYRSGWDFADPVRLGWTYMMFSWTAIGAALVTLGARLAVGARAGSAGVGSGA